MDKAAFENLLNITVVELKKKVLNGTINNSHVNTELEKVVVITMKEVANRTGIVDENKIIHISGQRFPDIIIDEHFGVEVKSTTSNHWETLGNSVFEGTRVKGVEEIYLLFGKMDSVIEFKCKAYEECLSDIVITHSPRYKINMDLDETIFDKMGCEYNHLRSLPSPIKPIVDYYKSKVLKSGEELWWINQNEEDTSSSPIIRFWSALDNSEKTNYKIKAMAYFPTIFGKNQTKFNKLALWLTTSENIVCTSLRDLFTSGGKRKIKIGDNFYTDAPQIISQLVCSLKEIIPLIEESNPNSLFEHWEIENQNETSEAPINIWTSLILTSLIEIYPIANSEDFKNDFKNRINSIRKDKSN